MIVKKNIRIKLVCTIFEGIMLTIFAVGVAQLKKGEYNFVEDLASAWWAPILCGVFLMFKELLDSAVRSRGEGVFKFWEELMNPYQKIELDSCGIHKRGIGRNGETIYRRFKSWKELKLNIGMWYDCGGFVFHCPPEVDGDSKWIMFFKVNLFLANRKQLMEFAVKQLPVENISDEALLRLKKMGISIYG